jgi:predicted porin
VGGGLSPAQASQLMDQLGARRQPITFSGVGAMYEHGPWQLNAEYTWLRSDTQIADTTGWYVNAGYRWGAFTPFIAFSRIRVDDLNIDNPLVGYVSQVGALGDAARMIQAYQDGSKVAQQTLNLDFVF